MLESVLLFAGAGASYATSPEYPLTKGFFEGLDEQITGDALDRLLIEFLETKRKDTSLDVEVLLWAIGEVLEATAGLQDASRPGGHIVHSQFLSGIQGHFTNGLQAIFNAATHLRDAINACVYRFYARIPKQSELDQTWTPLIESLRQGRRLDIFTTNYDRVLETAVDLLSPPIQFGRRGRVQTVLDLAPWRDTDESAPHGTLTKLHGSVDWVTGPGDTVYYGPDFFERHEGRIILYPGLKGEPDREPFKLFHQHFVRRLEATKAALFVGYAFRDPYINELISEHLPADARVVVLDPTPPKMPPRWRRRSIAQIKKPFTVESGEEALKRLLPAT